jgi:hypothetical protein
MKTEGTKCGMITKGAQKLEVSIAVWCRLVHIYIHKCVHFHIYTYIHIIYKYI